MNHKMSLKCVKRAIIDVPERIYCDFWSQAVVWPRSLHSRAYRGRTLWLECTQSIIAYKLKLNLVMRLLLKMNVQLMIIYMEFNSNRLLSQ